jgi:hypothetical protein
MNLSTVVPRMVMALVATVGLASTVSATPWLEIGDAGNLPGTAQVTLGFGPLTSISGFIGNNAPNSFLDADMFRIHIPTPALFSATTVGTGGSLVDTMLFLFDVNGFGVYADDDVLGSPRSRLPAGSPLGPQVADDYFLLITAFGHYPVSAGGLIFPQVPRTQVFGPTGPGGGAPISGYTGFGPRGSYTINLTGAEFAAPGTVATVPEPGTLLLLGVGLVGLARRRRRQPLL